MLRITASFAIALLFLIPAQGQRCYKKGFLLLSDRDTLWGYLSFYTKMPEEVYFKTAADEKGEVYSAQYHKGFRLMEDSFTYKAALVPYTQHVIHWEGQITREASYHYVFLKPMVEGSKLSLYKTTSDQPRYYVTDNGVQFLELQYIYISPEQVDESTYKYWPYGAPEVRIYDYKATLESFLDKWSQLRSYINQMPFTEGAMKEFVYLFNQGHATLINRESARQRPVKLFGGAGLMMARVNVNGRPWFIPPVKGRLHIIPTYTLGFRWQENDRAGLLSGSLSVGYSAFSGGFNGRSDTLNNVSFMYDTKLMSTRLTGDCRLADLSEEGSFSAGLFVGYSSAWLTTGPLEIKFPVIGDFLHSAGRNHFDILSFGIHLQLMYRHWELAGTCQVACENGDNWVDDNWYQVKCYQTGISINYHF